MLGTTVELVRKIGHEARQVVVQALTGALVAVPTVSWKK
jgi:hypothetical protein